MARAWLHELENRVAQGHNARGRRIRAVKQEETPTGLGFAQGCQDIDNLGTLFQNQSVRPFGKHGPNCLGDPGFRFQQLAHEATHSETIRARRPLLENVPRARIQVAVAREDLAQ